MYDVVCTVFGGHKMFDVCVCCSCFKDGGLACFEIALPIFLLPVHGVKLDVNSHLTNPTQHVMVGITRSKVYNFCVSNHVILQSRSNLDVFIA